MTENKSRIKNATEGIIACLLVLFCVTVGENPVGSSNVGEGQKTVVATFGPDTYHPSTVPATSSSFSSPVVTSLLLSPFMSTTSTSLSTTPTPSSPVSLMSSFTPPSSDSLSVVPSFLEGSSPSISTRDQMLPEAEESLGVEREHFPPATPPEFPKLENPIYQKGLITDEVNEGSDASILDESQEITDEYADSVTLSSYPSMMTGKEKSLPRIPDISLGYGSLSSLDDDVIGCPPVLPTGYVQWKSGPRIVKASLPHMVSSSCEPPIKCSVSTTVHQRVLLQEGDTLEVALQTPPNYIPPTVQQPDPASPTARLYYTEPEDFTDQTTESSPVSVSPDLTNEAPLRASPKPTDNWTHIFSRKDHHIPLMDTAFDSAIRNRRETDKGESNGRSGKERKNNKRQKKKLRENLNKYKNNITTSPLTLWKATDSEWVSCSTREGAQVASSGPDGIVTVPSHLLQIGTNYFIGRSSWSSSECFKLKVTVRSASCGEGSICSAKGVCYANSTMDDYKCKCCRGYIGLHCEEWNACIDDPCQNAGICVDINEGHDGDTFQCLCPYGYRGRYCEIPSNLCESGPCHNGATCTGNHSSYTCHCADGWTGPQCTQRSSGYNGQEMREEDTTEAKGSCAKAPCVHGVCVETTAEGFRCFCQPGFGGNLCEFEYNECESNPCENGGTCVDQIGGFLCLCGRGYKGQYCQIKVDLCDPDPCHAGRVCVDKGNSFSCECLRGFSEDDCGPHEEVCTPNPCENAGTCWIVASDDGFYCACRPGYTGTTCQGRNQTSGLGFAAANSNNNNPTMNKHSSNTNNGDKALVEVVESLGTETPEAGMDIRMPVSSPLAHMNNIHVAVATLTCALLIFSLVVGACHCRVNQTYRKCFVKIPHVLPSYRIRRTSLLNPRRDRNSALRLECDPDGASMPMTSPGSTTSDTVYFNMDVCDNQELPLIK